MKKKVSPTSKTPDQIASEIISKLNFTASGLSLEPGTPERKIVDAVAESISEVYVDQYLVGGLMDIENKSGLELEQWCLVTGTPVSTPTGPKPIESLQVGDEVITHTGKVCEVLGTSDRPVDEDVVTIRTAIGVEYTMTKNHPVWITRRDEMTLLASQVGNWRRDGSKGKEHALRLRGLGSNTVWDSRNLDREFVPAGEVRPGDIVWGPDPGPAGVENTLTVEHKRLLGYYLAEGHITHRERSSEIGFSFHRDEVAYQDEVEKLLQSEWGIKHIRRQFSDPNTVQLLCYDTARARWLEEFAGKGASGKHIPFGMEDEDWTPLVATYWNGDGTASKNRESLSAKTVSLTLASQLYAQMVRMGLAPRMTRSLGGKKTIMGRRCQTKDVWTVGVGGVSARKFSETIGYPLCWQNTKDYSPVSARQDGFVGSPVTKVVGSHYQGRVHNISVAGDNSYELPGSFGVHNCGIFDFGRLQGRKATGIVQVELKNSAPQDITIQSNSPFYTRQGMPGSGNPLYFVATQTIVIPTGSYVAEVPVECTVVGTAGNIPPDSVVFIGDILGATSVTNLQAFTGGVDIETDDELRQRFKDTFMRSVTGTEDFYLGLCYQNRYVSKAACFGPIKKYATQLIANADTDLSDYLTQDIKYAWPGAGHVFVFKDLGQDSEVFYQNGQDFTWVSGNTPSFTWVPEGGIEEDSVVDLEFEYTTRSSRNEPTLGITNKIDLFVNGTDPYIVTERCLIDDAIVITDDENTQLWRNNFTRIGAAHIRGSSSLTNGTASTVDITGDGPYTVSLTNTPTGGTWTLSYDGDESINLPYNASAAAIQAALVAMSTIGAANAVVVPVTDGNNITPFQFTVTLEVDTSTLTGTSLLTNDTASKVSVDGPTVSLTNTPTGGTYTLSCGSQTTDPLNYDASIGVVEAALEALTNIGTGNVTVTGTSSSYTVVFSPETLIPTENNRFMRLGSVPVVSFPSSVVIDGTTYTRGVHYHLLRLSPERQDQPTPTALMAGTVYEVVGIEWESTGPTPSTGTVVPATVTYSYNRVPEMIQAILKTQKQITTDVMIHQASYVYLRVYLNVEYDRGFSIGQVNNSIQERLRAQFASMAYGSWIEMSDIALAVHQVLGVDNVTITAPGDLGVGDDHGVKVYSDSADTVPSATHDTDFKLTDNQLPVFLDAVIRRRANR